MELSIKKFINELKVKPFVIFLAIPFVVQLLSYFVTKGSMDIYDRVKIPPLSPPSWLFPVVWTVLFGLMGISSYLVWNEDSPYTKQALGIYGIQLAFNLCWNVLFFVMEAFLVSLIWLMGLLILIIIMIAAFRRISPAAAYLQIPYGLWVAFACYLNAGIYYLN
ncbi:MAG: tryptophan-rich sensory protein [Ruminococcus sp.]|nr:tryptophan-rich sensory protein [Ruminococcus sp.]